VHVLKSPLVGLEHRVVVRISTVAPSIDVVIPAHNNRELTESCLAHLERQTVEHSVTVVDDGSTDGTSSALAERWPDVHVITSERARGFVWACNTGVAARDGDVVVLLNNDVDCHPSFLEEIVAPIRREAKVGSVAAVMLQPGGRLIDSVGITCDVTLAQFKRLHGLPATRASVPSPVLVGPEGTAAAYRRSAWAEASGFDESLVAYGEDFELALRLGTAGWSTAAAPNAVGVHQGSATYGRQSARARYLAGVARGYVLRRYGILRGRHAVRALSIEAVVAAGSIALARDCAGLRGRVSGWRQATGEASYPPLPSDLVDRGITIRASLAMRHDAYGR
jgi:GT2 family glycosyltransferase